MTFKLMPGDYIPTADVPEDKRQAVIDAFVAAGARQPSIPVTTRSFINYECLCWLENTKGLILVPKGRVGRRLVTLSQILGEQPSWDDVGPELLETAMLVSDQLEDGGVTELAHIRMWEAILKAKELMK